MPAAVELAKEDGFATNTSVWIGALSEVLTTDAALRRAARKGA
jgi:hypothetical protein